MNPLHFNLPIIEFLANHRTPVLTHFFIVISALGKYDAYIIVLIYVAWDKKVAVRLAVLMSLTSSLNILLKLIIRNPRPFVLDGTYMEKWAVPPQSAKQLAAEFSTPSGHAMSSATFYLYLFAVIRNWYFRAFAIAVVVLIGISRPYLGVHYVEDVLFGWGVGLCCALLAVKYCAAIGRIWCRFSYPSQVVIAVAFSIALWLFSIALNGGSALGQATEILSESGFLAGVLIAYPLELRLVNFDPQSCPLPIKILRVLFTALLVVCATLAVDVALESLPNLPPMVDFILYYVRALAEGVVIFFLAPLLFTRIGLALPAPVAAD